MPPKDQKLAISPTDLRKMRTFFDDAELLRRDHCFHWDTSTEEWQLISVDHDTHGTIVATLSPNTGDWTVV